MRGRSLYRTFGIIENMRNRKVKRYFRGSGSCGSPEYDEIVKKYDSEKRVALSRYGRKNPLISGAAGSGDHDLKKAVRDCRISPESVGEINRYLQEITGVKNAISRADVEKLNVPTEECKQYGIEDLLGVEQKVFTERLNYLQKEIKRLLNGRATSAYG